MPTKSHQNNASGFDGPYLLVSTTDSAAHALLLKNLSYSALPRFKSFFPGVPFLVAAGYPFSSDFR